jgi:hypothetical protein
MDAAIAVVRPGVFLPAQQQVMLSALLQHVLRAALVDLDATAIAVCIAAATGGLHSMWFQHGFVCLRQGGAVQFLYSSYRGLHSMCFQRIVTGVVLAALVSRTVPCSGAMSC